MQSEEYYSPEFRFKKFHFGVILIPIRYSSVICIFSINSGSLSEVTSVLNGVDAVWVRWHGHRLYACPYANPNSACCLHPAPFTVDVFLASYFISGQTGQ